jgi:hypothetical protein
MHPLLFPQPLLSLPLPLLLYTGMNRAAPPELQPLLFRSFGSSRLLYKNAPLRRRPLSWSHRALPLSLFLAPWLHPSVSSAGQALVICGFWGGDGAQINCGAVVRWGETGTQGRNEETSSRHASVPLHPQHTQRNTHTHTHRRTIPPFENNTHTHTPTTTTTTTPPRTFRRRRRRPRP